MTCAGFARASAALVALTAIAISAPASAEVNFAGKRIELVVPYGNGGGTGVTARFLAPLLEKKLPGHPTIIIKNIDGAGAIAGSNYFQEHAKPNGLTVMALAASVTANYVFRDSRVKYKVDEWIPIITIPAGTIIYANSKLGLKGPADIAKLRDQELSMGAGTPTGGEMRTLLALDLLGFKVKSVFGVGRADARPAFERGEFNINFDSNQAYPVNVVPLIESGVAVPLFSLGITNNKGVIERDPVVPDLPSLPEAYKTLTGKDPDGDAYKAWLAVFNLNVMASKALALPAGTPDDIVETYNKAMEEVVAELRKPEMKAQADEVLGPYPPALGKDAVRVLRSAVAFDDSTLNWLKAWLKKSYGVE